MWIRAFFSAFTQHILPWHRSHLVSAIPGPTDGEEKVVSELLQAKMEGKISNNGFKKSTFNEIA